MSLSSANVNGFVYFTQEIHRRKHKRRRTKPTKKVNKIIDINKMTGIWEGTKFLFPVIWEVFNDLFMTPLKPNSWQYKFYMVPSHTIIIVYFSHIHSHAAYVPREMVNWLEYFEDSHGWTLTAISRERVHIGWWCRTKKTLLSSHGTSEWRARAILPTSAALDRYKWSNLN